MKTRPILLSMLIILIVGAVLSACGGPQPNRYEARVWVVVGTFYEIRDENLQVVQEQFCWALDEECNGNPWGFPTPETGK